MPCVCQLMLAPSILIISHASTKCIEEGKMSIYWVRSYYGKPGKVTEYLKWLTSDRAKLLASKIEKETGIKYANTYTTIQSFGDYDAEDWWVLPDWASLDKLRDCNALAEWTLNTWDMIDQTRPQKSRMMRTVSEVKTIEKPEKWTELL